MTWREKLKHAFAVDTEESLQPDERQLEVINKVAKEIARRRLTTPALLFLEMSRPLNYVASQAMVFLQPIASIVLDTEGYDRFAQFLEHRGSVKFFCRRIEFFESQYESAKSKPSTDPTINSGTDPSG